MRYTEEETILSCDASLQELLDLASSKFSVHFERMSIQDVELDILQISDLEDYIDRLAETTTPDQTLELPYWAKIWPTSILLAYYVRRLAHSTAKNMLEIGAGIGLCGLTAAAKGMRVCISDSESDALLFSRINILQNGLQDRAEIAKVDFTRTSLSQTFHYIVGSEVLYREAHYQPLISFFLEHIAPDSEAEVVLARDYRISATRFFELAQENFTIQEKNIGYREKSPSSGQGEKHLCTISRLHPRMLAG